MSIELVFIRHGETRGNILCQIPSKDEDMLVELTEKGKEQARERKRDLENEQFDTIFASDMQRAKQTADIIFGDRYPIHYDARLREAYVATEPGVVFDYGIMPKETWIKGRLAGFETGEPFATQVARVRAFRDTLVTGTFGQKIAIVTHNGCLRTLEVIYNNMSLEDALAMEMTGNCGTKRFIFDTEKGRKF